MSELYIPLGNEPEEEEEEEEEKEGNKCTNYYKIFPWLSKSIW